MEDVMAVEISGIAAPLEEEGFIASRGVSPKAATIQGNAMDDGRKSSLAAGRRRFRMAACASGSYFLAT